MEYRMGEDGAPDIAPPVTRQQLVDAHIAEWDRQYRERVLLRKTGISQPSPWPFLVPLVLALAMLLCVAMVALV